MNSDYWNDFLGEKGECGCGKNHSCRIEKIVIEEDALSKLPVILSEYSYRSICIVSDINTEKIAGERVGKKLADAGCSFQKFIYREEDLIPDEKSLGKLLVEIDSQCELILAVGSGTINDICKFVSYKLHLDFWVIATAPSMDGYASNVAPLIVDHAKTTYEACLPGVIIGDLDILCQAPLEMISAGVGDVLGKFVCLADWRMAHLITGEYYCERVASLVRTSIQKVTANIEKAADRDKGAVASIMEGLILSGIAMSYVGNSRPASGSEHHLAHFWEMISLMNGSHAPLHGTKVGVGTVLAIKLYKKLKQTAPDFDLPIAHSFDFEIWKESIKQSYGAAADGVIALEEKVGKNQDANVEEHRKKLKQHREELWKLAEELPEPKEIEEILSLMNAPYRPEQIGVDQKTLYNSILYAKELRNRFGILQILFDTDLLEQMAGEQAGGEMC